MSRENSIKLSKKIDIQLRGEMIQIQELKPQHQY